MTRELLILRHGKADAWTGGKDFDRPLTNGGKRDVQRVGVWLQGRDALPDATVTSPAERAQTTAEKCLKAGGGNTNGMTTDGRVYEASRDTLLDVLAGFPDGPGRLMLVGHNPGVEALASHLSGIPAGMAPGFLVRLEMPDDWSDLKRNAATLMEIVNPDDLPIQFPYPAPGAEDLRPRPAYYYKQSSVIPYRWHEGQLQILVISSSKQKHWVIPKGIKDPGMSPQDSAAKEAFEEAGVEGRVWNDAIGGYTYDKWGATCKCTVYPMEVTRTIPEAEWEESHRERLWVTPEQAAGRLKQSALRCFVIDLAALLNDS